MWILVFFDLPTETKKERKTASDFRKQLIQDGFVMFQFSIYIRNCPSWENAEVHIKRVRNIIPPKGKICILTVTDKQFGKMEIHYGGKKEPPKHEAIQLELF